MKDTSSTDDWRSLCELASKETNPQKLLELITRINRALEKKSGSGKEAVGYGKSD
jgi:L-asparaginase/Glu-tRNA(Gln) amidotransferase subunit D